MAEHMCGSCKAGENPDVPAVVQVDVRDGGRIVYRGWLCEDHHCMYADDGYNITVLSKATNTKGGTS